MKRYECIPIQQVSYPPYGCRPPELYKYPEVKSPVKLLFLGWNPPKPFGGFWSDDDDNLRSELHGILKELGQIKAVFPDQSFLDEFLEKGFYLIHTVKCWTETKFPGFGQKKKPEIREVWDNRKDVGIPLINSCVRTHLDKELKDLAPRKVCALGEIPFRGLCELFPWLPKTKITPTDGQVFPVGNCGLPWPLLYTCLPRPRPVLIRGTRCRKPASDITLDDLRKLLQSH